MKRIVIIIVVGVAAGSKGRRHGATPQPVPRNCQSRMSPPSHIPLAECRIIWRIRRLFRVKNSSPEPPNNFAASESKLVPATARSPSTRSTKTALSVTARANDVPNVGALHAEQDEPDQSGQQEQGRNGKTAQQRYKLIGAKLRVGVINEPDNRAPGRQNSDGRVNEPLGKILLKPRRR
jgi:hypothetical protein